MSNIFNDPTETQLNERTINLQNLSVLQPTLPILDIDNVVTGQIASSAGLALLNITSIADLRSQILENDTEEAIRLTADSTNEINFYTNGTTASELRMQITDATTSINNTLQVNTVRSDTNNIISFHTGGNPTINNRRLYITNELIQLSVGGTPTTLTVDEADGRIIISEMLTYENHTGVKLNFWKDGSDANGDLYEISVDTTGNNKIIYKSPNDHLFRTYDSVGASDYDIMLLQQDKTFINNKLVCNSYAYNDGSTYPSYIDFDAQHAHFRSPNGIRINDHFQIDSTNGGQQDTHLFTSNTNKNIKYTTNGTGTHSFLVGGDTNGANANEILRIDSTDTTISSTNLKTNNIVSNTDNTYSIGTSSTKYSNIYGNTIHTTTITTPTNTHLEISPNGSGNIRTNRPFEIPAAQSIMRCKENNKHFQLNLAPNNESPNDNSASFGSGLTFWSSFYATNDAASRLFANINCRTVSADWGGGRLEFRVREAQGSGFDGGISGDRAALTSLQMTITATTVDILKRLNVSSHIIPTTDNTADLGEIPAGAEKRFRNGYINNVYTDVIDFEDDIADKLLLYGTSYKLAISNNSLDYITGFAHTFKRGDTTLLILDSNNIIPYKNITPNSNDSLDVGSATNRFRHMYSKTNRIIGEDGYIDMRNKDYSTNSQGFNTPPLYFNSGYVAAGVDHSEVRKSMIIGACNFMPSGEATDWSRNNIVFCCNASGNTDLVSINDERFRIGQLANYSNTHLFPKVDNSYDLGSNTNRFRDIYTKSIRVIDNGGYIDLRGFDYTTNGEGSSTTPIYFNTGYYAAGGSNNSLVRKSMILGVSNVNMPSGEVGANSRNNIIFCCATSTSAVSASVGDEKFRIGQLANYSNTHLFPKSHNLYDLGKDTEENDLWWRWGYFSNLLVNGSVVTSDRRLKKNVEDLELGLNTIQKLKPKKYEWINDDKKDFGLIAQDVEEITELERIVHTRKNGLKSINYTGLIPILIKSIQEQQEQINQLLKRVEILETGSGNELSFI